ASASERHPTSGMANPASKQAMPVTTTLTFIAAPSAKGTENPAASYPAVGLAASKNTASSGKSPGIAWMSSPGGGDGRPRLRATRRGSKINVVLKDKDGVARARSGARHWISIRGQLSSAPVAELARIPARSSGLLPLGVNGSKSMYEQRQTLLTWLLAVMLT